MKNRNIIITTILLALGSFALPQKTQAVSPAPDGGYPGGNTAEGQNALLGLTTGTLNTAIGFFSLRSNTDGKFSTAIGAYALFANTADENTATGAGALLTNSTGSENTATGAFALFSNTGGANTADGAEALEHNTIGNDNTAIGDRALQGNTEGSANTANGAFALESSISGSANTASGFNALGRSTASNNTAIGESALANDTSGASNTAVGDAAGINQDTGSNDVYIGAGINGVAGESNTCRIASIFGQTAANGSAVFITSGNKLGTDTSSKRFKEEIRPMDQSSEPLLALQPVTFRYKKEIDPEAKRQFGLVAEEVEKVNPDLVVRDKEGKAYSVRYDQVNAMLLNEFLKEHRKVEKLEAALEAVNARLKEQDSKLKKVSDEMELSRSAPRMVLSNP